MTKKNMKKRIGSLLVSVAILIPLLAMAVYASSDKVAFTFNFNGADTTMKKSATKTDIGESTAGSAGVTISNADFGAGSVSIWVENSSGQDITNIRSGINRTGTYTLYYNMSMLPASGAMTAVLRCKAIAMVQTVAGTFQP